MTVDEVLNTLDLNTENKDSSNNNPYENYDGVTYGRWITGFEGLYSITKAGLCYSWRRCIAPKSSYKHPALLKEIKSSRGYRQFHLTNSKGMGRKYYVHRLVAETYIPNPDDLPVVNHKNFDKSDNRVENLEWTTFSTNITYMDNQKIRINYWFEIRRKEYGPDSNRSLQPRRCIAKFDKDTDEFLGAWSTIRAAAKSVYDYEADEKLTRKWKSLITMISLVCSAKKGKKGWNGYYNNNTASGYKWKNISKQEYDAWVAGEYTPVYAVEYLETDVWRKKFEDMNERQRKAVEEADLRYAKYGRI